MKIMQLIFVGLIAIFIIGCSVLEVTKEKPTEELKALILMTNGDSLEAVSALHEAALVYSTLATEYPNSSFYKKAVLKAAYLFCSPLNPSANDSVSLKWYKVYADLPITVEEKNSALSCISLLNRIITLQKGIENIAATLKKQNHELTSRSNQVRELEAQLEKTKQELNKLKEIDVKVYQRGTKK